MSCEDCLSRRDFLTRSSLAIAGVAALASGCGDGTIGASAITAADRSISVKVASLPGLATVGQLVLIPPADSFIVAKRTGPATFLAFSTICTHEGTNTSVQGQVLVCPNHLARYDSDGRVTQQPQAAGRATDLPRHATSYDGASDTLTIAARRS